MACFAGQSEESMENCLVNLNAPLANKLSVQQELQQKNTRFYVEVNRVRNVDIDLQSRRESIDWLVDNFCDEITRGELETMMLLADNASASEQVAQVPESDINEQSLDSTATDQVIELSDDSDNDEVVLTNWFKEVKKTNLTNISNEKCPRCQKQILTSDQRKQQREAERKARNRFSFQQSHHFDDLYFIPNDVALRIQRSNQSSNTVMKRTFFGASDDPIELDSDSEEVVLVEEMRRMPKYPNKYKRVKRMKWEPIF